jgi:hypothetical protein
MSGDGNRNDAFAMIPNMKKHTDGPGNEGSGISILR